MRVFISAAFLFVGALGSREGRTNQLSQRDFSVLTDTGFAPFVPIKNSTISTSTPTPSYGGCENSCSVEYPRITAIRWIPKAQVIYTTQVTVATVSVIYMKERNSTRAPFTETAFNYAPSEYKLYSLGTNDKGTAQVTIPFSGSDGYFSWSRLAYPTAYTDYASEYSWYGTLQTVDKFGEACVTATPDPQYAVLREHPEYPQPLDWPPPKEDTNGTAHVPLWVSVNDEPDKLWFDYNFPSESAFANCKSVAPSIELPTVYPAPEYITVTTTVTITRGTEGIVIIQPSETGWETSDYLVPTPGPPNVPSSIAPPGSAPPIYSISPVKERLEQTADGLDDRPTPPLAQQTGPPQPAEQNEPPSLPDYLLSIIQENPGIFSSARAREQANQQATASDLPGAQYTMISTTVNGTPTSLPGYIIGGTSTATIGQTVVIDGTTTVLSGEPTQTGADMFTGAAAQKVGLRMSVLLLGALLGLMAWL
ncbi:hypothetical protein M011DRAFT_304819 [Sporormia fimetaria CBS 119925]|uniref:Lytic polysaccharide monooxygenase n=1 Tax=Sporormia fimetaria CBS 119925 TaxID=1340428 RepID=A0A6A6VJG7_9PLEO|nr:hypothetical protein M011DRAFT_304819 [Sporormia fimetaria CBS 119925]